MRDNDIITTFDGQMWTKADLLERMVDNEFYYGYLGKNMLSSSSVKDLLKSPRAYANSVKYPQDDIDAFKFGRVIHEAILEPDMDYEWNIVEAKDKRSKEWKDAVKENIPNTILKRDHDACMRVVGAYNKNSNTKNLLDDYDTEVPMVGVIDGVPFRAKADAIHKLRDAIRDLKTTGDILKFNKWTCMSYGYDCQVYIYCELFGVHWSSFDFIAIDKITHVAGLYDVSEEFYEGGKRKTLEAIATYKKYFMNREEDVKDFIITNTL
tara:strand:- start:224 stop:1021 length:798 start_codon:yes stop_codon:yes gene_type:complete